MAWFLFFLSTHTFLTFLLLGVSFAIFLTPQTLPLLLNSMGLLFAGGLMVLLHENTILIGFLWILDLGLFTVFLLFFLNLFTIFYARTSRGGHWSCLGLLPTPFLPFVFLGDHVSNPIVATYIDYGHLYHAPETSELILLHDIYFFQNSAEFILINFYILITLLFFLILFGTSPRFAPKTSVSQLSRWNVGGFLRDQNFLQQGNTNAAVRLWTSIRRP